MSYYLFPFQVFNKKDKKDRDRDQQRDVSPGSSALERRTITDDEGRVYSKDPISGAKEIQRELSLLADKAGDKSMSKIECSIDVVVRVL